jgi:hypothetical protein
MKKFYFLIASILLFQQAFSQTVIIGNGTAISAISPFNRHYEYNVFEVIYPASEIMVAGTINKLAFERVDGTEVNPIDSVSIYMQHTTQTDFSAGTFSLSGYTLVYEGTFPNDSGSGWREVTLTNPFPYDGLSNLQILAMKGYQPIVANTPVSPRWYYTSQSNTPVRRYQGSTPATSSTTLNTTNFRSNARLEISSVGYVEIGNRNSSLFPNPSLDWIQVENPGMHGQLTILNAQGSVLFSSEFIDEKRIDLADFSSGIYHILLQEPSGKRVMSETFIKN